MKKFYKRNGFNLENMYNFIFEICMNKIQKKNKYIIFVYVFVNYM